MVDDILSIRHFPSNRNRNLLFNFIYLRPAERGRNNYKQNGYQQIISNQWSQILQS